ASPRGAPLATPPGGGGAARLLGGPTPPAAGPPASCTGQGEAIIKVLMAKTAVDLLAAGLTPATAAKRAVELLERQTGAQAGLILVDRYGAVGFAHNAEEMPVCVLTPEGQTATVYGSGPDSEAGS
ncbi:MAG: isoaspartyl peptidase/L-asparaginase, partial [Deltaproteobacteria bacterium]|nr:isoaspartyl peptidase/L-asparaginase [Deltaproteobacteria bacterium]